MRVKMYRCVLDEPMPPAPGPELEAWCESGRSGRPIQTHVGDEATVTWAGGNAVRVRFDDGDERTLYRDEVQWLADEPLS